jgi:hypothetical protein
MSPEGLLYTLKVAKAIQSKPTGNILHENASLPFQLTSALPRAMTGLMLGDPEGVGTGSVSEKTKKRLLEAIQKDPKLHSVNAQLGNSSISQSVKNVWQNKDTNVLSKAVRTPMSALGALAAKLMQSDSYDPWSHTVRVFSDNPAIGLHELGHARTMQGSIPRALIYGSNIPGHPGRLVEEALASSNASRMMKPKEKHLVGTTLAPAYGSYLGAAAGSLGGHLLTKQLIDSAVKGGPLPANLETKLKLIRLAPLLGIGAGHIAGRVYNKYKGQDGGDEG